MRGGRGWQRVIVNLIAMLGGRAGGGGCGGPGRGGGGGGGGGVDSTLQLDTGIRMRWRVKI